MFSYKIITLAEKSAPTTMRFPKF